MRRFRLLWLLLLAPLLWLAGRSVLALERAATHTQLYDIPGLSESSALARSNLSTDLLWTLNDSGNPAELFAVDTQDTLSAKITVEGARNFDWETLASYVDHGQPRLLIGDVGDNFAQRKQVELLLLDEPSIHAATPHGEVRPLRQITLRFPDGPRDCEAVFVDAHARRIFLISKRDTVPRLYSLPLPEDPSEKSSEIEVAQFDGELNIPRAPALTLWPHWINWITAADLSADGLHLAVMTPSQVHLYTRMPEEGWPAALQRPPLTVSLPMLPQAEGVAWSADGGTLIVTSEGTPMPVARLDVPASAGPGSEPTASR